MNLRSYSLSERYNLTERFVYTPTNEESSLVEKTRVEFQWFPGFSKIQKQRSTDSLHKAFFEITGISNVLEISSTSKTELGIKASAFNLIASFGEASASVECFYQASKVFEFGGPYTDIIEKTPYAAKKDPRIRKSGRLIYFLHKGERWELNDGFYDWLYINALIKNKKIGEEIVKYEAYTDIAFNPLKSFNCQAYSAAMYTALMNRKVDLEVFSLGKIALYRELIRTMKASSSTLF